MMVSAKILKAKVFHRRLSPKVNTFRYAVSYLCLPLSCLGHKSVTSMLPVDRWGAFSFYRKDHGDRSGNNLELWAQKILQEQGLDSLVAEITLVSMPRVLGYLFNPVSFWLCFDQKQQLRAVLAEVNNTFGETHTYLCAHEEGAPIAPKDDLKAKKLFVVSPFLHVKGGYHFRFAHSDKALSIRIDYYDETDRKVLETVVGGSLHPLTKKTLRKTFWGSPLMTLKVVFLIHFQALKLFLKGVKYVGKQSNKKKQ